MNIPLTGVPLREELERRFGVPVFVDNDANCAGAGRGPARGRRPGERARDAHARHGRGRRRGDRRRDLPRRPRPGSGARPLHDRPGGPALPGQLPRAAAASRPTAAARRSSATPPSSPATCPTRDLAAELDDRGRVTGRALVGVAREGDGDALRRVRPLRTDAGRGHRRVRERLRAGARGDRRRPLARRGPLLRQGRGRGALARAARSLAARDRLAGPRRSRAPA